MVVAATLLLLAVTALGAIMSNTGHSIHHRTTRYLMTTKQQPTTTAENKEAATTVPTNAPISHLRPNKHKKGAKYSAEALADEVVRLPGLTTPLKFRQFSGYLPISETKRVFYWFFEAQDHPQNLPLTLWTNGGPGCSGLRGLMSEHGPFRVNSDGKTITLNPYSWNKLSNMLYIEMPVGVGFSYSTNMTEYNIGDEQTTLDTYMIIQTFFARFPHLRDLAFFLTSESYGGHYIPQLTKKILQENAAGDQPFINLKGFAVGNPFTDPVENEIGKFESLWAHKLVDEELYTNWTNQCKFPGTVETLTSDVCVHLQNTMITSLPEGQVNPYGLGHAACKTKYANSSAEARLRDWAQEYKTFIMKQWLESQSTSEERRAVSAIHGNSFIQIPRPGHEYKQEECQEEYASTYLNTPAVKEAIHANQEIEWRPCSRVLRYALNDQVDFMEPYYQYFIENYHKEIRIMIYSGQDDAICGTAGTRYWIDRMGWSVEHDWTDWKVGGKLAGTVKTYEGGMVNFVIVHGAGHLVPTFKPADALNMFDKFLKDGF